MAEKVRTAVKMLLPDFRDDDFIQLFLREARVCSQLNHPNIVSVLDFGSTNDGLVFLVMEYLEGQPFHQVLKRAYETEATLSLEVVVQIAIAAKPPSIAVRRPSRTPATPAGRAPITGTSAPPSDNSPKATVRATSSGGTMSSAARSASAMRVEAGRIMS